MMTSTTTIREYETAGYASEEEHRQFERLLYTEARLLDGRKFMEWLNMTAPDVRYWVPRRMSRSGSFSNPVVQIEQEISTEDDIALMDDDRMSLMARFMRLATGMAWAENPASRTSRVVGNVEVFNTSDQDHRIVLSTFMLHAARWDIDEHTFAGQRRDLFVSTKFGYQLKERHVILTSNVLRAPKLSIIF